MEATMGDAPSVLSMLAQPLSYADHCAGIDKAIDRLAETIETIKNLDDVLIASLEMAASVEAYIVGHGITHGQAIRWRARAFREGRRRHPGSPMALVCAWPEELPDTISEAKRRLSEFMQAMPEDRPARRRRGGADG